MSAVSIVIATPHHRNDLLEHRVRTRLPAVACVRLRSRAELSIETLEQLAPDFVFFPHWSWMIPEDVFARFNCVIFHMTDLPYGRGGSPLQNLIVRGHEDTKISALKCVRELDAGPIYLKRPLSLAGTAEEILERASAVIGDMIVEIVETRPDPIPQTGEVVQFARRQPSDGDLAAASDLREANDFIRMLDADGYPPAFLTTEQLRLEFTSAQPGDGFIEAKVRITKRSA